MYKISIQRATRQAKAPESTLLRRWAKATLSKQIAAAELTIRIVSRKEMTELNSTYRRKAGPTNVLSFPFTSPPEINEDTSLLGDIVICAEVVNMEAMEQGKKNDAHWAHMVVHGTLHLLGYDHEKEVEAVVMEAQEVEILHSLGFSDPYQIKEKGERHER